MRVSITVCDICGDPALPTTRWSIKPAGGRSKPVDLCEKDAKPLKDLYSKTSGVSVNASRRGRPASTTPVMTLEEIEATKVAQESSGSSAPGVKSEAKAE